MQNVQKLKIIIIGAGIAGMAAAVGCGLAGHDVLVLEGAPEIGEVGAGLQVPPNMLRILEGWGLGASIRTACTPLSSVVLRRYADGKVLGTVPIPTTFGPQSAIHRADLHRILSERALAFPNVKLRTGSFVEAVTFSPATCTVLHKASGQSTTLAADVILAADGVRSRVRAQMSPNTPPAAPTGDAAYRILLPVSAVTNASPALKKLLSERTGTRWLGPGRHIMAYPLREGADGLFNMVMVHPDPANSSQEGWTNRSSTAEVRETYAGWNCPLFQELLSCVPEDANVCSWRLAQGIALDTWTKGSVALLGDAAHPMVPYVAQGAAQAVEDAAVLARVLGYYGRRERELAVYQKVRKHRAESIQTTADQNRKNLHYPDGPEQKVRDAAFSSVGRPQEGAQRRRNPDRWADATWQEEVWAWDVESAVVTVIQEIEDAKKLAIDASDRKGQRWSRL